MEMAQPNCSDGSVRTMSNQRHRKEGGELASAVHLHDWAISNTKTRLL